MYLVRKILENQPEFLKSQTYQNMSCTVNSETVAADEQGRKYVYGGSLLDEEGNRVEITRSGSAGAYCYSFSSNPVGILFKTVDVTEKELIALESPRNSMEEAEMIRKIFEDVDNLVLGVKTRIECMRMEALSTGKIAVNENGVKATIDYGMPTNHKTTKTWKGGTPTILEDMDEMVNQIVKDTGFTPARALTSKPVLNTILRDERIRSAVFGVNSAKMLTVAELNAFLAQQSLPQIAVYDKMYRKQEKNGKYISMRFLPEESFVMMPDGKMGDTFYGLTAEELELRKNPAVDMSAIGTIIVAQYATTDPVAKWVKAVATAMPSFPYADQVFSATIQ